jgi:hypothetical protein
MSPLSIREDANGGVLAASLFRKTYGVPPPNHPHHVIAFHRAARDGEVALCYIHFTEVGDLLLGGGACVDKVALRRVDASTRAAIRDAGGLYRMALDWAVAHFAPRWPAIFGYCGDPLAERVDLAAGFERTAHAHLLVHWTRALQPADQRRLIGQAHAIGPF